MPLPDSPIDSADEARPRIHQAGEAFIAVFNQLLRQGMHPDVAALTMMGALVACAVSEGFDRDGVVAMVDNCFEYLNRGGAP